MVSGQIRLGALGSGDVVVGIGPKLQNCRIVGLDDGPDRSMDGAGAKRSSNK
jgi:hypothetical protein